MKRVIAFYQTTTGKKVVMAVTGLVGFGFVIIHMLGNLQVFLGPEKIDAYGKLLKSSLPILWGARLTLLGAVTVHVVAAIQLAHQSVAARPVEYAVTRYQKSTYASRTMRWSGPLLLLFIIYHLLHFTAGAVHPGLFVEGEVYNNLVKSFQVPYISAAYIAAMLALSLHLYHGAWSLFQSLGLNHPRYNGLVRTLATLGTLVVVVGNIAIPAAILAGVLHPVVAK